MTKQISWSDLADIPADVCPSSLDENLQPVIPYNTAHRWDDTTEPQTCAECGTEREHCATCDSYETAYNGQCSECDDMGTTRCPDCLGYDGEHLRASCTE